MRTPARISFDVLEQRVDEYIQERKRLLRPTLREAIIHVHQQEGEESPQGEEMEANIGVLELLMETGTDDPDTIFQLFEELEFPPEAGSQPSHTQILASLKKRLARPKPHRVDDATLDQYHFEVTGKISVRCTTCRRGRHLTEKQFLQDRFQQRVLLGHEDTCPRCRTGQMKVSGVTAVRNAPQDTSEREKDGA